MEYTQHGNCGRRLVIYGENGSGKSHTCKAIARWAKRHAIDFEPVLRHGGTDMEYNSPRCLYWNWLRLIDTLKAGFNDGTYTQTMEAVSNVELAILDDVGTDNDPNKFGIERFYQFLETRERRFTIISTNIDPGSWESRFERRIASRLLRNATHIPLTDVPDYNSHQ